MISRIIIDGENALLGRLASYAAKQALNGKDVIILNSEKIIISGKKEDIAERYKIMRKIGGTTLKGLFFSALPYKIVKKTVKGMLPKNTRGKTALKKVKCYEGIPKEFENEKKIKTRKRNKTYKS